MEISGSIAHNLRCAIQSAKRLRGRQVHADTLQFWRDLVNHARTKCEKSESAHWMIDELISKLEVEISNTA